ncbi:MAG: hypothetical protein PHW98_05755 [Candidatus Omnitrophica bacterium]|nr:hypothetical protein [Candidatus Omnitrophota bacterium]
MKKLLFLFFISLITAGLASAEGDHSGVGFQEERLAPLTDFRNYSQLYISGIDLREMRVKMIDTDGDAREISVDDDTSAGIAFDLNKAFSEEISKVLPVAEPEGKLSGLKALKGQNVIVLDVKLTYERAIEEVGTLDRLLLRKDETMVSDKGLTIECVFRDADSGKALLKLSQTVAFDIEDNERPFAGDKDKEELGKLIKIWASRTGRILAKQRGVEYASGDKKDE